MVAEKTARKWASRYRLEGEAGTRDRSSRPHRSPAKTPEPVMRQIVTLRRRLRLGPVQIAGRLGLPASTVHAVLTRCRLNRLSRIDRATGEPLRNRWATAIGALRRAVTWFAEHGACVEPELFDNGSCYRSHPSPG